MRYLTIVFAAVFGLALWQMQSPAATRDPVLAHQLFGINASQYHGQAGITSLRYYARGVPEDFPGQGTMTVPEGITPIVSLNVDPGTFAKLPCNGALGHYLLQAPSGTLVTVDHEANLPGRHIDRLAYLQAVRHLAYCAQGFPVLAGQIFSTYPVDHLGQNLGPWVVPGLGFYGLDGYQRHASDTAAGVFGRSLAEVAAAAPTGVLGITETGSFVDADAWGAGVYRWAASQPRVRLFAFYGCPYSLAYCPYGAIPLPSPAVLGMDARLAAAP
jgi:hypothetical protein